MHHCHLQGGCIIRAVFLDDIYQAYKRNPGLENLMMDKEFAEKLISSSKAWRSVVTKVCQLKSHHCAQMPPAPYHSRSPICCRSLALS